MDKSTWLDLPKADRELQLKILLSKIVQLKKEQKSATLNNKTFNNQERYQLEQRVLDMLAWLKSEDELE